MNIYFAMAIEHFLHNYSMIGVMSIPSHSQFASSKLTGQGKHINKLSQKVGKLSAAKTIETHMWLNGLGTPLNYFSIKNIKWVAFYLSQILNMQLFREL